MSTMDVDNVPVEDLAAGGGLIGGNLVTWGSGFDKEDGPPDGFLFILPFLDLRSRLMMERVSKALREAVRDNPLVWQDLHVDRSASRNLTDMILLDLVSRAKGQLKSLSLSQCLRTTDSALQQILDSNPRLETLSVPGCTGLSAEALVKLVETHAQSSRSRGLPGITQLRIRGLYNITKAHLDLLHFVLEPVASYVDQSQLYSSGAEELGKNEKFARKSQLYGADQSDGDDENCACTSQSISEKCAYQSELHGIGADKSTENKVSAHCSHDIGQSGAKSVHKSESQVVPQFYGNRAEEHAKLSTRPIDVEICQICTNVRVVYDCTRHWIQYTSGDSACKGCTFCIPRCEECGRCIRDRSYEDTLCSDLVCADCWFSLPKCSECNRAVCDRHAHKFIHGPGNTFTCDECLSRGADGPQFSYSGEI